MSEVTEREFKQLCDIINNKLGFTYGAEKEILIFTRLEKRLKQLNIGMEEYIALLQRDSQEVQELVNVLTTNVTYFFREKTQLDIVESSIFSKLRENGEKVRCWSAGCSSGEEPYTLAMMLKNGLNPMQDFSILATDINVLRLQDGSRGIYQARQLETLPVGYLEKNFTKLSDERYQVNQELRQKIVFRQMNLNDTFEIPPSIKFDFIFCRNVFIYFSREVQMEVLKRFQHVLKEGGSLILGSCENMNPDATRNWKSMKNSIYQKL